MHKTLNRKGSIPGFSLLELISALALVSVLALIGFATMGKLRPAAEATKLRSDVQNINSAISVYKHSGGNLSTTTSAEDVIAKLKTVRQKNTTQEFVGFTGAALDPRTSLRVLSDGDKGPRAIYDPAKQKFVITDADVEGYQFDLNDLSNSMVDVEETRDESALSYATNSNWVWDYDDVTVPDRVNPTLVTLATRTGPEEIGTEDVADPTAPEVPNLQKLDPPIFSIPTGNYQLTEFSLTLALTNPNGPGTGKIIYGIISDSDWEWLEYTGAIQVSPADKVLAFVESLKPKEFHHSDPSDEFYDWTTQLESPLVEASPNDIDARTGSTTITITSLNDPDFLTFNGEQLALAPNSFSIEYKLVPSVPGEGTETEFAPYTGPFDVGGPQFPRGFDVVARVVGNNANFTNSSEVRETVTAFYKLDPPIINSSVDVITNPDDSAVITLTNPNPNNSSTIQYQIHDDEGNVIQNWVDYSTPFTVAAAQYPSGFNIVAKAVPVDPYYRESDLVDSMVDVTFFGIPVAGETIFILDSSGSMSENGRIDRLKNAANTVLGLFDEDDSFAVIDYDSAATVIAPWGPGTAARRANTASAIDAMEAEGFTNYHAALNEAIALNASGATQVIFLSDGQPFRPDLPEGFEGSTDGILELVDQLVASGVERFDTISLGTNQPILEQMSNRGRGRRVRVDD